MKKNYLPASSSSSTSDSKNNPSVLIADDLELSIHQLTILLNKCGYNVYIARNTAEAKDHYKKKSFPYVILDLFLPDSEDGFNLIKFIKNSEASIANDTKIIIVQRQTIKIL